MRRSLRNLYFSRAAFSLLWVALVSSIDRSSGDAATLSAVAGLLLVFYPISDAVATLVDLGAEQERPTKQFQRINVVISVAASAGIASTAFGDLAASMTVFGTWAIVSGAIQLLVASRRLSLSGQWPMIISGAGSVIAGTAFIGWAGPPSSVLRALTQYATGGAIWYLASALWLRRASGVLSRVAREGP